MTNIDDTRACQSDKFDASDESDREAPAVVAPAALGDEGRHQTPDEIGLGKRWPTLPPLSDAEREKVHQLLEVELDKADDARKKHAAKLERMAFRLGKKVAVGEVTLPDALARIEAFAYRLDPTCSVPVGILHRDDAREISSTAFNNGVRAGRGL